MDDEKLLYRSEKWDDNQINTTTITAENKTKTTIQYNLEMLG